jgi:hypothetical protein
VVHSLFKEYHSCARSFSLQLPPLAFSLSRLARTRLKKLLKKLKLLLRKLLTPLAMPLPLLRTLPVKPLVPLRKLLLPLVMPLLMPLVLPLPLLRKPLLPLSNSIRIGFRIGRPGFGPGALSFVRGSNDTFTPRAGCLSGPV